MSDDKSGHTADSPSPASADAVFVPARQVKAQLEIKKSKFTGICCRADTEKEARAIIVQLKNEHKDATHVVYAFICGRPNSQVMGMSDDGEPKGTAGRPVLQVLKGSGLTNVLCAVIRYFGGTKLGTGGLVKAYTETAQAALEKTSVKKLISETAVRISVSYDSYNSLRRIIASTEGSRITAEDFMENVLIQAVIPDDKLSATIKEINNSTSGKAVISCL